LGDTVTIGEAALGICFPLKAFSSHPMHPVPHLSTFDKGKNGVWVFRTRKDVLYQKINEKKQKE